MAPVFVDQWRMPIGKETRAAVRKMDWEKDGLDPAAVLKGLPTVPQ